MVTPNDLTQSGYEVNIPVTALVNDGYFALRLIVDPDSGVTIKSFSDCLYYTDMTGSNAKYAYYTPSAFTTPKDTYDTDLGYITVTLPETASPGDSFAIDALYSYSTYTRSYAVHDNETYLNLTLEGGSVTVIETPSYGDINQDGKVSLADAVLLSKAVASAVSLNDTGFYNADCNRDGTVDSVDLNYLMKFLIRVIQTLPVKE